MIPKIACPVRLGKVLRIIHESRGPAVVFMEPYWPVLRPEKYGEKVNLFSTWVRGTTPKSTSANKSRTSDEKVPCIPIPLADVLVWPVEELAGADRWEGGLRIPFNAIHHLRDAYQIDLALPVFSFAERGKSFYAEVVANAAFRLHANAA